MSKTTITINGEECVILPAPKGAFLVKDGSCNPTFIEYLGMATVDDSSLECIYAFNLSCSGDYVDINVCSEDNMVIRHVFSGLLDRLLTEADGKVDSKRNFIIELYQTFVSHGTPFDYSAIWWFKKRFQQHNITKADFDVFALKL